MAVVTFQLDDKMLEALKLSPEAASVELRLAGAMKLFELGKLSAGAAADLAGVPKPVFLSRMGEFGIATFDLDQKELESDVKAASKHASDH